MCPERTTLWPIASLVGPTRMDSSMHGNAEETTEAKRMIEAECPLKEGEAKCFLVMRSRAELAQVRDAKVQAVHAQMKEEDMVLV